MTSGLVGPVEMTRLKDPSLPLTRAAMSSRFDVTLLRDASAPQAIAAAGVDEGFFPLFGLPPHLEP